MKLYQLPVCEGRGQPCSVSNASTLRPLQQLPFVPQTGLKKKQFSDASLLTETPVCPLVPSGLLYL